MPLLARFVRGRTFFVIPCAARAHSPPPIRSVRARRVCLYFSLSPASYPMQPQQQDWTIRDGVPEDENAIVSTWLKSFAHSKYGVRRGAHIDRSSEEQDYWKEHRAIVTGLVRGETVRVACDPERSKHKPDAPAIIWAWCCTSGDDLLHYVLVKRSAIKAGLGPELVHALIGDRLKRRQWITFEQVELSTAPGRSGVPTPDEWRRADPLWIPRRQYAWAKAAAA